MNLRKALKLVVLNIFITLALLEAGLMLATSAGFVYMDLPSYSFAKVTSFWMDSHRDFGVWHRANSELRHRKSCFDVIYRTNGYGMRDRERPVQAEGGRVVVLGDSFVEGYGVDQDHALTSILEKRTGVAHLNFGTSNNFGLTQAWLLYASLASKFDHDAVILSVLPDNDFDDDDASHASTLHANRYRPYLVGDYPNYRIKYYHQDRLVKEGSIANNLELLGKYVEVGIREFLYISKAYSYFKSYFKTVRKDNNEKIGNVAADGGRASRYYSFSPAEFDRMRYAIEQVVRHAAPRPVLLMTIPRRSDYLQAAASAQKPPLTLKLQALAKSSGFHYVDLLERTKDESGLDRFFHSCDPHWNRTGHELAARHLSEWDYYAAAERGVTSSIPSGE